MEQLKKKRTQIKRTITKIYNFINSQHASYNDTKVRIVEIDKTYEKYKDVQDEIDILSVTEDEIQKENNYRDEIEEMYFSIKSVWAAQSQDNLENTIVEGATASSPNNNDLTIQAIVQQQSTTTSLLETMSATLSTVANLQTNAHSTNSSHSELRLPSIQLPDFDGDLSNWVRFRDLFIALVDSKENLSHVEKLEYLRTKLKGEASTIVKHLNPTNDNYKIAWDLIKANYDKPDVIQRKYFEILFDQKSVKSGTSVEFRQFYNNTVECYNALKVMNNSIDSWDCVLLYLIEKKLDQDTLTLWHRQQKDDEPQTFPQFLKFLSKRAIELENIHKTSHQSRHSGRDKVVTMAYTTQTCPLCNGDHFLYSCQQFKSLVINERRELVRANKLCFNCLKDKHFSKDCKSGSCKICSLKHNTLLHIGGHMSESVNNLPSSDLQEVPSSISINSSTENAHQTTLLPTAIIMVRDKNNSLQPCRALIDSGAQSTLISEACAQRLKLDRSHDNTLLYGVGGDHPTYTKGKIQLEIYAKNVKKTIFVKTYCLSNLTQYLPTQTINSQKLNYFKNLELADPAYNKKNRIDIIIGADVFAHCISEGRRSHPSGSPIAVNTIFGWIVIGNVNVQTEHSTFIAHIHSGLDVQLQKFWETEECNIQTKFLSPEEEKAEQHFRKNVQRQQDGRYMVRLPFKTDTIEIGESKSAAMRRLESMERKFKGNLDLKVEFHKFMDEYIDLNHMEISPQGTKKGYFMPHHAVLKPSSTTTKLRVVFDASCKSSNDSSLNDHLLVGPTVQNDLFTILLKFRKFQIGFTADVEKMYRQVLIHPEDRSYQRILWRRTPDESPEAYQLRTVTYGTAAAPFLATRALQQTAFDNCDEYPNETDEIINNFYVDDYMSCAPDIESANSLRLTITSILSRSGFNLRKWSSNSQQFREGISPEAKACASETIIDSSDTVKTLGLLWNTTTDCFQYSVYFQESSEEITKRRILSDISKIFDPIGWLSPVVITLKIFMQKLWLKGIDWDQNLPNDLKNEWLQLKKNIEHIEDLQIPRWCNFNIGDHIELHGYSDSSELAYAAAIYIRIIRPDGSTSTCLLTAKTRVTPIRQITLPRLELCAAHLMVKLMMKVKTALHLEDVASFGWTDSTVVLAWISDHPRRWKSFVANRTSFIIENLPASQWNHIASKQNPADLATRGISSTDIIGNTLWWQGPHTLQNFRVQPHSSNLNPEIIPDKKKAIIATAIPDKEVDFFNRYSSYSKLLRITALIFRFIENCKSKKTNCDGKYGFLTTDELDKAHAAMVKLSQQLSYGNEIRQLTLNKPLSSTHKLAALTPFLDSQSILRVGGRLENADINYDQKHPYILHKDNNLTLLIVRYYHIKYLHAGTRQMHYLLSLKYWIPNVTYLIKRVYYSCTICMRFRQLPYQQRMGDLPNHRVQPGSTFINVGIDFAGPILIRSWKGRGSKSYKCWIAVYVCLSTKAIHLEAVTELSTAAMLASLRRFVSRRGKPIHIYSDNGTNFVGCNQELRQLFEFLHTNQYLISNELSNQQIQWHFIPPSAPNFGGVWEAGVKSVKFHLKRVLGNSTTTYEELTTLLCQIECCLNSRPLCLKFEGDTDPLTPGHFLILRPMTSIPDENLIDVNVNRLTRWQYMQQLVQQFWSKWSMEYLTQLQKKPKWDQKLQNLQINDVVLIKDDNLSPTQWLLGKITTTHPGKDGLVRVATVKTKNGLLKRSVSKLCPLFIDC